MSLFCRFKTCSVADKSAPADGEPSSDHPSADESQGPVGANIKSGEAWTAATQATAAAAMPDSTESSRCSSTPEQVTAMQELELLEQGSSDDTMALPNTTPRSVISFSPDQMSMATMEPCDRSSTGTFLNDAGTPRWAAARVVVAASVPPMGDDSDGSSGSDALCVILHSGEAVAVAAGPDHFMETAAGQRIPDPRRTQFSSGAPLSPHRDRPTSPAPPSPPPPPPSLGAEHTLPPSPDVCVSNVPQHTLLPSPVLDRRKTLEFSDRSARAVSPTLEVHPRMLQANTAARSPLPRQSAQHRISLPFTATAGVSQSRSNSLSFVSEPRRRSQQQQHQQDEPTSPRGDFLSAVDTRGQTDDAQRSSDTDWFSQRMNSTSYAMSRSPRLSLRRASDVSSGPLHAPHSSRSIVTFSPAEVAIDRHRPETPMSTLGVRPPSQGSIMQSGFSFLSNTSANESARTCSTGNLRLSIGGYRKSAFPEEEQEQGFNRISALVARMNAVRRASDGAAAGPAGSPTTGRGPTWEPLDLEAAERFLEVPSVPTSRCTSFLTTSASASGDRSSPIVTAQPVGPFTLSLPGRDVSWSGGVGAALPVMLSLPPAVTVSANGVTSRGDSMDGKGIDVVNSNDSSIPSNDGSTSARGGFPRRQQSISNSNIRH